MMKRCREYSGEIFVADENTRVIGFITVLSKMLPSDPDEYPIPYAFISELVVREQYRSRGIGRSLISQAEEYAKQQGVAKIRLQATAANSRGRQFYARSGYRELVVELIKQL